MGKGENIESDWQRFFSLSRFLAGICQRFSLGCQRLFSGRGEIPHRRYPDLTRGARERPTPVCRGGVSRSGEMPEPTVIVRMKEDKTDLAVLALVGWPLHARLCLPFHALILVLVLFRSFTMNQSLLSEFGDPVARVEAALSALRAGGGVLVADDEDRENEGDLIFAAESMTNEQMALMIRECSGIVCLCLTDERVRQLELPMMVEANSSHYQTAFTVTIEAAQGVTTGVSAADRITTIRAAIADGAKPGDLNRPGHVFPLRARTGGVLVRRGHTEATVDLMQLAGLKPFGVLCELTREDGSMARLPDLISFGRQHRMPVITIEDLVQYRQLLSERTA